MTGNQSNFKSKKMGSNNIGLIQCLLQYITAGKVNLPLFILCQFPIERKYFFKLRPHLLCIVLCDVRCIRQDGNQLFNRTDTARISTHTAFTVLRFRQVAAGIVMFLMVLAEAGILRLVCVFFRIFRAIFYILPLAV